jgi:hypothetical protein
MVRYITLLVPAMFAGACLTSAAAASGGLNVSIQQGFPWQGFSMFTIVMALLYAGHVAQDRTSLGWRILLFILGFPLTFVVSFLVVPGSQRVLGVDLPRQDLQVSSSFGANNEDRDSEEQRQERKAAWDATIAILCSISLVLLVAPSTEYRSQPLDDGRFAVEKTVFWGFWGDPWLSYRREGIQQRNDGELWTNPEWTTAREWTFEASIESVLTLLVLLAVFALCVRDERIRTRRLEDEPDPPQRTT